MGAPLAASPEDHLRDDGFRDGGGGGGCAGARGGGGREVRERLCALRVSHCGDGARVRLCCHLGWGKKIQNRVGTLVNRVWRSSRAGCETGKMPKRPPAAPISFPQRAPRPLPRLVATKPAVPRLPLIWRRAAALMAEEEAAGAGMPASSRRVGNNNNLLRESVAGRTAVAPPQPAAAAAAAAGGEAASGAGASATTGTTRPASSAPSPQSAASKPC